MARQSKKTVLARQIFQPVTLEDLRCSMFIVCTQMSVMVDLSGAQVSPAASLRGSGSGRRVKFSLPAQDMLEKMKPQQPPSSDIRPSKSALKAGNEPQGNPDVQFSILYMDTSDITRYSTKSDLQGRAGSGGVSDSDPVRFSCGSCSFSWLGQELCSSHCPKCWQKLLPMDETRKTGSHYLRVAGV